MLLTVWHAEPCSPNRRTPVSRGLVQYSKAPCVPAVLYRHEADSRYSYCDFRSNSCVSPRSDASQCACWPGEQTVIWTKRPFVELCTGICIASVPTPPSAILQCADFLAAPAACSAPGVHSSCQPRTHRSTAMQQPTCLRQHGPCAQRRSRPDIRYRCRTIQTRQRAGAPVPGLDGVQGQVGPVH